MSGAGERLLVHPACLGFRRDQLAAAGDWLNDLGANTKLLPALESAARNSMVAAELRDGLAGGLVGRVGPMPGGASGHRDCRSSDRAAPCGRANTQLFVCYL